MNIISERLYYYVALLQLENYELDRYLGSILKVLTKRVPHKRKGIEWTTPLKVVILIAILSVVLTFILTSFFLTENTYYNIIIILLLVVLNWYLFFTHLIISTIILKPIQWLKKEIIVKKAKDKRSLYKDLLVIGISGSYGKTTVKEALLSVLSVSKNVIATKGNENTPFGVSNLIQTSLNSETEVMVVEMGEHVPGDIKELCEIVLPDYGVITGINTAHLERMGSLTNTTSTIFEIYEYIKKYGKHIYYNSDDERVRNYIENLGEEEREAFFTPFSKQPDLSEYVVKEVESSFSPEKGTLSYSVEHSNISHPIIITTSILGSYGAGVISLCFSVGTACGMNLDDIKRGIESLKPIKNRLEFKKGPNDSILIDDSYNGNTAGVEEGLFLLKRFVNYNKIYITPGLVELGADADEIHYSIGLKIASVADKVILIDTSARPHIEKGLIDAGFSPSRILIYTTMPEALEALSLERVKKDVVLIQNDWTENYR